MRNQITHSSNPYLTAAVAAGIVLPVCQRFSIRIFRHRVQALETLIRCRLGASAGWDSFSFGQVPLQTVATKSA